MNYRFSVGRRKATVRAPSLAEARESASKILGDSPKLEGQPWAEPKEVREWIEPRLLLAQKAGDHETQRILEAILRKFDPTVSKAAGRIVAKNTAAAVRRRSEIFLD